MSLTIDTFICSVGIDMHLSGYISKRVLGVINCVGYCLLNSMLVQIMSGIIVSWLYIPSEKVVLYVVRSISVEVSNGYMIKNIHGMGTSVIIVLMKIHIYKLIKENIYEHNISTYYSGFAIYVLVMWIGFLGYSIVWGQMSYWGGTVICGLLVLDVLKKIVMGGSVCGQNMLSRLFVFHFILPIVSIWGIILHVFYLHLRGSKK